MSGTFSRKNWKRRWFVLQLPLLLYLESPDSSDPLGAIHLPDVLVVNDTSSGDVYSFSVHTPKRNYFFVAESALQVNRWIWSLAAARAALGVSRDKKMLTTSLSMESVLRNVSLQAAPEHIGV